MDYIIRAFGGVTVETLALYGAAIVTIIAVGRKVMAYIAERAVKDKERDEQIQKVIDQSTLYPKWHQQSLDIREELTKAIGGLRDDMESIKNTNNDWHADDLRAYILRFNVELLREDRHTREDFIEVLAKIDEYEQYCKLHEEYKNNRAVAAIRNIKNNYDERLKKHDFL